MVLVGYWPLNESSGSTAFDYSGNENHGTVNDGGDSTVPGASGVLGQNAYSFDGSNDYVKLPDRKFTQKTTFTISAWFKADSLEGERWIFAPYYDGTDHPFHIRILDGQLELREYVDGESFISAMVSTGVWYHVIGVHREDTGKSNLYINGGLKDSGSISNGADAAGPYGIGSFKSDSGWDNGDSFSGKISEVSVSNHALTPQEVQYLYQVGKRGRQVTSVKKS